MTPEERKLVARKELARRELARRAQPEDYGSPVQNEQGQFQVGGPVDIGREFVAPLVENTIAAGTGMAAAIPAQIGGGIQKALDPNNPVAGFQARDRIQDYFTYKPRVRQSQEAQQRAATSPPAQFLQQADEFVHKGEEVYGATGSETLAKVVEAAPSYAMAIIAGAGLLPKVKSTARAVTKTKKTAGINQTKTGQLLPALEEKAQIKQALINKVADPRAAKWKLSGTGEMVLDDLYKAASKQGWPDEVIEMAKHGSLTPANKSKYLEMIHITKRALKDLEWGANNRPTQVTGGSQMARFDWLRKTNKILGESIDNVAQGSLAGKYVDHAPLFQAFDDTVRQLGGKLNDKGKLVFPPGARLAGQAGNQKGLATIQGQINALGPNPDGYALHVLKQTIDDFVSYGKTPGSQSAMSGKSEGALKALRDGINKKLQGISSNYDDVNTGFAETKGAIKDLGDAFGKTIWGEGAEKVTGIKMRQWIGNAPNRQKVMNAFNKSDEIARKYGGEFSDTAEGQVVLANALDDILTNQISRSSLKADVKGAGGSMLEKARKSTLSHVEDATTAAKNRMFEISDEQALIALEDLIRGANP